MVSVCTATMLGIHVPRIRDRGEVRGAGPRAVNISWGKVVVSLLRDPADMTVLGVAVPELWRDAGALPARFGPAEGSCRFGASLELMLNRQRVTVALPPADFDGAVQRARVSRPGLGRLVALLMQRLDAAGHPSGLLRAVLPRVAADPLLCAAADRLRTLPDGEALDFLGGLVGRGIGMTPSADDFITGVLAADATFALTDASCWSDAAGQHLRRLRTAVSARLGCTTEAGRSLLWAALNNAYPEYLRRMLIAVQSYAIGSAATGSVSSACRTALRHGSTSGTDAVAGVVWHWQRMATAAGGACAPTDARMVTRGRTRDRG